MAKATVDIGTEVLHRRDFEKPNVKGRTLGSRHGCAEVGDGMYLVHSHLSPILMWDMTVQKWVQSAARLPRHMNLHLKAARAYIPQDEVIILPWVSFSSAIGNWGLANVAKRRLLGGSQQFNLFKDKP
jgi:hypothetical protein